MTRPAPTAEAPVTGSGWMALRVPGLGWSTRVRPRSIVVTLVATLLAFAVFVWSLTVGEPHISAVEVLRLLGGGGDPELRPVLFRFRLARGIAGLVVGAALGAAGLIFQRVTRNPLATPDVIGISGGATAAAAFAIVIAGRTGSPVAMAALGGGFGAAILIFVLARRHGGVTGYRMVLVGVGVTFASGSVTAYLVSQATLAQAQRTITLLVGSLAYQRLSEVQTLAWAVVAVLVAAVVSSRSLRVLELGDDAATGLGAHRERARLGLVACAVALASLAAAIAGPVAFVALIAAQIARSLVGDRTAALLPAAAIGALLVSAADLAARELVPRELPVGVLTAAIGAPFLLAVLWRANRTGAHG